MPTFTMPQEQPGWWDTLSRLVSPPEAAAEVTPMGQPAADLLARMQATPQPTLEAQLHGAIVDAAQRVPENVRVDTMSNPLHTRTKRVLGHFQPPDESVSGQPEILVDPTGPRVPKTMAHELLHFLNYAQQQDLARRREAHDQARAALPWYQRLIAPTFQPNATDSGLALGPVDNQHAFIDYLLGQQGAQGQPPGRPFDPQQWLHRDSRPVYQDMLARLLRDPQLLSQALGGMQQMPYFRPPEPIPPGNKSVE